MINGNVRKAMDKDELDEYLKLMNDLRHCLVMINQYSDNLVKATRAEVEAKINLDEWNGKLQDSGNAVFKYECKMNEKYKGFLPKGVKA